MTDDLKVVSFKNRNGEGVVAEIQQQGQKSFEVLCGNTKLMKQYDVLTNHAELSKNIAYLEQEGKTVVVLAVNRVPALLISLEEQHLTKPEAKFVVDYLQKTLKMRVCMITGDNRHSALAVANHLGIDAANVTFEAYPETKKEVVEQYQRCGSKVLFIGDGINDSPVLAQADVGCAINSASDITVSAAGIVLVKDSLADVLNAVLISRETFKRIQLNFFFAFSYNVVLIPVAMGLFYPVN